MAKERRKRDYSHLLSTIKNSSELGGEKKQKDDRFWQLMRDKDGNGFAIIRFLPDKDPNSLPFRPVYKHAVTIDEKLFLQKCPSTINTEGQPSDVCPVCKWNQNQPSEFVMDKKTYRKKSYVSNILIIKDPSNPENEGKIFLFEFGPQIYKILYEKMFPTFAGDEPLLFFDPDKGANFKIKIKKDGQFASWATSEFSAPSVIEKTLEDFELNWEKVEESLYNLKDVIADGNYRTYDELSNYWNKFLKSVGINVNVEESIDIETAKKKEVAVDYVNKKKEALSDEKKGDEKEDDSNDESKDHDDKFDDYFKDIK